LRPALADLGHGDQLTDRRLQRLLVRFQPLQAGVEQHAVADGQNEQRCDKALDHYSD
jgi:hypothetical protein